MRKKRQGERMQEKEMTGEGRRKEKSEECLCNQKHTHSRISIRMKYQKSISYTQTHILFILTANRQKLVKSVFIHSEVKLLVSYP